jgi:hypothetical protein
MSHSERTERFFAIGDLSEKKTLNSLFSVSVFHQP